MGKLSQVGIAVGVLGGVIVLIGLFPSVTGLEAASGVGILQIVTILIGFATLILGVYIYVQSTYYDGVKHNLAQQIGVRLSMTGLVIAVASGLADVLGFGSHPPGPDQRPVLGIWQIVGILSGFMLASLGVIIFALMGDSDDGSGPPEDPTPKHS